MTSRLPRLPRQRTPRAATPRVWLLLLCALMLLAGQGLQLGHVHGPGHGLGQASAPGASAHAGCPEEHGHDAQHGQHEDSDIVHGCALCFFKAAGQDGAALLPARPQLALPLPVVLARLPAWAAGAWAQAPRAGLQARGPPHLG